MRTRVYVDGFNLLATDADASPPQRTTGNTLMKERNPCPILRTPSTS